MKKILSLLFVLSLLSGTASAHGDRSLNGTHLGVAKYKFGHKGPNRAALRVYMNEIDGERGSYHVLLHEYVNLFGMAPQYVAANKAPALSKVLGYLKNISKKIEAYKAVPTSDEHVLELMPLRVQDDKIVAIKEANPRKIIFSKDGYLKHNFEGAIITSNGQKGQPKEIFFPRKKDGKMSGTQYGLAKTVYEKVGLDSTWRKKFLPGPYLSAYGRLNDEVLTLTKEGASEIMEFKLGNPKYADRKESRREKMFTSPLSANLEGKYTSIEAQDGMFILSPMTNTTAKTDKVVVPRIGLFIDIFDATKALNQDVVELVFINPENPEDFLMYYEHPENGEGE